MTAGLHERQHKPKREAQVEKSATDQFITAAAAKPRRRLARYQKCQYEGPTAPRDVEEAERRCWIQVFTDLGRNTPTPMGQ